MSSFTWMIEGLSNDALNLLSELFNLFINQFIKGLGPDITAMEHFFPLLKDFFVILQTVAIALVILLMLVGIFKNFFGKMADAEHPFHLVARAGIAVILIFCAMPIMNLVLDFFKGPYDLLLQFTPSSATSGAYETAVTIPNIGESLAGIQGTSAAFGDGVDTGGLTDVAFFLVTLFMFASIFINFIKLLLEAVERYVILGVLYFTSPLGMCLICTKETSGAFKAWVRMVMSQGILLLLNVWFLKGFAYMLGSFFETIASGDGYAWQWQTSTGETTGTLILWTMIVVAYLKVAQKMDSYMATLGLNSAQAGGNLWGEMIAGGKAVGDMFQGLGSVGKGIAGTQNFANAGSRGEKPVSAGQKMANSMFGSKGDKIANANGTSMGDGANKKPSFYKADKYVGQAFSPARAMAEVKSGGNLTYGGSATANQMVKDILPNFAGKDVTNASVSQRGKMAFDYHDNDGNLRHVEATLMSGSKEPTGAYSGSNDAANNAWYVEASGIGSAAAVHGQPTFTGSESMETYESYFGQGQVSEGTSIASQSDGTYIATKGSDKYVLSPNSDYLIDKSIPSTEVVATNKLRYTMYAEPNKDGSIVGKTVHGPVGGDFKQKQHKK